MPSSMNNVVHVLQMGGLYVWPILILFAIAIGMIIERSRKLYKSFDVDAPSLMNEIQRYVLADDVQGGIRICAGSPSALAKVLKNGLKKAEHPIDHVKHAVEATALEVIPQIEARMHWPKVLAHAILMLGVLGTLHRLIQVFSGIAAIDPTQKMELLSMGMSKALTSTGLALFCTIVILLLHAILVGKANSLIADIEEHSAKLVDMLSTKGHRADTQSDQL